MSDRRGFDRINDKARERCEYPITPFNIVDYLYCPRRALLAIQSKSVLRSLSDEGLLIANTIKACYSQHLKQEKPVSWKQVIQRLNIELAKSHTEDRFFSLSELSASTSRLSRLQSWYETIYPVHKKPLYVGLPINYMVVYCRHASELYR